ncbi:MAG: hypothetical protein ACRDFW_06460, partial [bacterium]
MPRRIEHGAAASKIHLRRPRDGHVLGSGQHLAGGAIERVLETVLVERDQRLARLATDGHVGEDQRRVRIVVPHVVRRELVCPRMAPVNKLLTSLGDRPVIRYVVQTTLDAGLDPATVVVGPDR